MRNVTETYTVYQYNELSENAKQKVKDWYLNDLDHTYLFSEDLTLELACLFGKDNDLKVQYSLGYCQGDGLNIYGSITVGEIISFLECNRNRYEFAANPFSDEDFAELERYAEYIDSIELPENRRYCYCLAHQIEFADEWINELEDYEVEDIDVPLIKEFEEKVIDIFGSLCHEYAKRGYEFFYEISDEDMEDICENNEWEFYEDGRIY